MALDLVPIAGPTPAASAAVRAAVNADTTTTLPDFRDTLVNNIQPNTIYDSDSDLDVGRSGFGNVTRSFLQFKVEEIKFHPIRQATLALWQHGSGSCGPQAMLVEGAGQLVGGSTWNTQPPLDGHHWNSAAFNNGAQCGTSGGVSLDITALVTAWAANRENHYETLALVAADEGNAAQWKMFYSGDTFLAPHITVTYGPYVYRVCAAGALLPGDNVIAPTGGQAIDITIVNAGLLPNSWTIYDWVGSNHTIIDAATILPSQTHTFHYGAAGELPRTYHLNLYTAAAAVRSNYSVSSYTC